MNRIAVLFVTLVSLAPSSAVAQLLLDEGGKFGPEPTSDRRRFAVVVQETTEPLMFRAALELTQGKASVRMTDPDGKRILAFSTAGPVKYDPPPMLAEQAGTYHVEIVPEQALGTWSVRITTTPKPQQVLGYLGRGAGMVYIGIGAVLLCRLWSKAKWRWFWIGAGVWAVGVGLKFACALVLNEPVLQALNAAAPQQVYLVLGSIYIGLLTGVFEIGVTLLVAHRWKQMTVEAARGVSVGVSAGAFEALALGVVSLMGTAIAMSAGGQLRDDLVVAIAPLERTTPLLWLAASVERIIAILCHTSSRALVLLGVARGRWFWPFVGGFLIMTGLDGVAGYVQLAGFTGNVSMWWIELALTPAAVLSIPIIVWSIRKWPRPT